MHLAGIKQALTQVPINLQVVLVLQFDTQSYGFQVKLLMSSA